MEPHGAGFTNDNILGSDANFSDNILQPFNADLG